METEIETELAAARRMLERRLASGSSNEQMLRILRSSIARMERQLKEQ